MTKKLFNVCAIAALFLTIVSFIFFCLPDDSVISEYGFKLAPSDNDIISVITFVASLLAIFLAGVFKLMEMMEE